MKGMAEEEYFVRDIPAAFSQINLDISTKIFSGNTWP